MKAKSIPPNTTVTTKSATAKKSTSKLSKQVEAKEKEATNMTRLAIDIPEDLHRRIKSACSARGKKMADEIRALLVQKYGKD